MQIYRVNVYIGTVMTSPDNSTKKKSINVKFYRVVIFSKIHCISLHTVDSRNNEPG